MKQQSNSIIFFGMLIVSILLISGCGKGKESAPAEQAAMPETQAESTESPMSAEQSMSETISFNKAALYPEGVEFNAANNQFLVTSMREGIVGTVSPDGNYNVLFQDKHMVSAVGIRIDAARDKVLVCNSDPGVSMHTKKETQGKLAGLAMFQLSSGSMVKYIDLASLSEGGGHFCNDIAVDENGIAYVTDSFSPIIYKIDTDNNASIFMKDDKLAGEGFGLNGIVIRDGYLLVSKYNDGTLYKFPLDDPQKYSQVTIEGTYPGADGLIWTTDNSLVLLANASTNKVLKLTSDDDWATAKITGSVDTGQVFATTGVEVNGDIYVLQAMLHMLFNPETKEHPGTFNIQKITF